jgi:hypothetical protein
VTGRTCSSLRHGIWMISFMARLAEGRRIARKLLAGPE